jgi:hypothetical protein
MILQLICGTRTNIPTLKYIKEIFIIAWNGKLSYIDFFFENRDIGASPQLDSPNTVQSTHPHDLGKA